VVAAGQAYYRAGVIEHPPDYDFVRSTFRFRAFGDDLASRWADGALHRVLRSGRAVRIDARGAHVYGSASAADRADIHHMLGLVFDRPAFAAAYPELAAAAPGFYPPLVVDPFEMLVTSVTAQQVSLIAACAIRNRVVRRFGRPVRHDGVEWWAFPRAADVAGQDLEGLGLSRSKIRAIGALATADLDFAGTDEEGIRTRLLELPGIGPWTVDWFLARCLGRPDAFAAGDLGVRKAVARWASGGADPIWPEARVREACLRFGQHANLAVHHLLIGLAGPAAGPPSGGGG
jgi:3-methyladenine DNA glycosylase/8-oxoguanine DNA glycosylase